MSITTEADKLRASVERLRALAEDVRQQYAAEIRQGEPQAPEWIDDALAVCKMAEECLEMVG